MNLRLFALLGTLLSGLAAQPAAAQCFNVADAAFPLIKASLPQDARARLTYLSHSSFLIETAKGATAVTDYHGYHGGGGLPDIVTMNNAHTTHFTSFPDPGIRHALRGWDPGGGMAEHDITYLDMRVRNVPTNVRSVSGGTRYNGNSIFIFEIEDVCIAHLGHLHHELTPVHVAEIGRIDVLLVPFDGGMTMSHQTAAQVIKALAPPVVVPMHYFGGGLVESVAELLGGEWKIVRADRRDFLLPINTEGERIILVPSGGLSSPGGFGGFD